MEKGSQWFQFEYSAKTRNFWNRNGIWYSEFFYFFPSRCDSLNNGETGIFRSCDWGSNICVQSTNFYRIYLIFTILSYFFIRGKEKMFLSFKHFCVFRKISKYFNWLNETEFVCRLIRLYLDLESNDSFSLTVENNFIIIYIDIISIWNSSFSSICCIRKEKTITVGRRRDKTILLNPS